MDLQDLETRPASSQLKIERFLEEMDENTRSIVLTALHGNHEQYPHASIANGLTKHGYHCSEHAVKSWRRRHIENTHE